MNPLEKYVEWGKFGDGLKLCVSAEYAEWIFPEHL